MANILKITFGYKGFNGSRTNSINLHYNVGMNKCWITDAETYGYWRESDTLYFVVDLEVAGSQLQMNN